MEYRRSAPLLRWRTERRDAIRTLRAAHAAVGAVTGPGRPLDLGKPVARAYVMVIAAEFQAFARELHGLAIDRVVTTAGVRTSSVPLIAQGLKEGRSLDRGNATLASLQTDFRRIGLLGLNGLLGQLEPRWSPSSGVRDKDLYDVIIKLRNCHAHGNHEEFAALKRQYGVRDTVSWADRQLPVLNRFAAALDRAVWNHLSTSTGGEPW